MNEEGTQRLFERQQDELNRAVIMNDSARLRLALEQRIPEEVLAIPALHSRLRRSRGNAWCRLGDYKAAESEYSAGFADVPYDLRGDYLLDWAVGSVMRLFIPETGAEKRAACRRCIHVLDAADEQAGFTFDTPYLLASTRAIRAFVHAYLGEAKSARQDLESIQPPRVPIGSSNDLALASFFTQIPKALAVALELRDKALLTSLCSTLLTGGESARLEMDALPVGEQLATVLLLRRDTPKFHDSWWTLVGFAHELAPSFPVLRQFAERMRNASDPVRIATFVNSACL